jgi:hypothetical protein
MVVPAVGERCWAQCMNSEWDCFEGDSMNPYGKPTVYIVRVHELYGSHQMYLYPNILLQLALNKESGKEVER